MHVSRIGRILPLGWQGGSPLGRYEQAEAAFEAGDFAHAHELLSVLAAETPNDPRVLFALGSSELALGRAAEAEVAFRRTLELDPGHALAADRLALALEHQGRYDEAASARQRAAALEVPAPARHQVHRGRPARAVSVLGPITGAVIVLIAVAALGIIGFVVFQIVDEGSKSPYEQCMDTTHNEQLCRGLEH